MEGGVGVQVAIRLTSRRIRSSIVCEVAAHCFRRIEIRSDPSLVDDVELEGVVVVEEVEYDKGEAAGDGD